MRPRVLIMLLASRFAAGCGSTAPQPSPPPPLATDDSKEAVLAGAYDLQAPLPRDPPPTVEVALPEGRFALATVTARQAFAALATAPPGTRSPWTGRPGRSPGRRSRRRRGGRRRK